MLTLWLTNPLGNKSTHTVVGLQTKGLGAVSGLKFTHTPVDPPTRGLFKQNSKTPKVPTLKQRKLNNIPPTLSQHNRPNRPNPPQTHPSRPHRPTPTKNSHLPPPSPPWYNCPKGLLYDPKSTC
jgi:hypothetical protein